MTDFSGEEPSDEDANEWLCDEAVLESMEVPEPSILLQERRVEWVVGLHQPSHQPRAEGPLAWPNVTWWPGKILTT